MNRLYAVIATSLVIGAVFYSGNAVLGQTSTTNDGVRVVCKTKVHTVVPPQPPKLPPTVPPTTPPQPLHAGGDQVNAVAAHHPAAAQQPKMVQDGQPKPRTIRTTVCKKIPVPTPVVRTRTKVRTKTVVVHSHPRVAVETVVPAPQPTTVVRTERTVVNEPAMVARTIETPAAPPVEEQPVAEQPAAEQPVVEQPVPEQVQDTPEPTPIPETVAFESPTPTLTPAPAPVVIQPRPLAATGSLALSGAAGTSSLFGATYLYLRSRRQLRRTFRDKR